MLTDYELAKTFFPETRKELLVQNILLLDFKDTKRIKLGVSMPLADRKVVGMPTWIGDSFDVMAREGSLLTTDKFGHDIKEMTLTIFPTDDSPKPVQLATAPLLTAFSLRRGSDEDDGELGEPTLHFTIYISATIKLWNWLYGVHRQSIYVRFETTQAELPLNQVDDKQMKLGEEDHEAARKQATSKSQDAQFANA